MQVISIPDFKDVITHVGVRHHEPVMAWGKPGVGKSAAVRQAATDHDAALVDIRLSQYDSVDLRGIPVPMPV
jgi:MoxR-like ATPase